MTLHLWESCESLFYAGYTEVSVWAIVFVIYILYVCVCVCAYGDVEKFQITWKSGIENLYKIWK